MKRSQQKHTLCRLGVSVLYSTPPSVIDEPNAPPAGRRDYFLATPAKTQAYRDSLSERMQVLVMALALGGRPVRFVSHSLSTSLFLNDCHLTAAGNRQMALDFAESLGRVATTRVSRTGRQ